MTDDFSGMTDKQILILKRMIYRRDTWGVTKLKYTYYRVVMGLPSGNANNYSHPIGAPD